MKHSTSSLAGICEGQVALNVPEPAQAAPFGKHTRQAHLDHRPRLHRRDAFRSQDAPVVILPLNRDAPVIHHLFVDEIGVPQAGIMVRPVAVEITRVVRALPVGQQLLPFPRKGAASAMKSCQSVWRYGCAYPPAYRRFRDSVTLRHPKRLLR